ncbi:SART-1 family-domain-containing protein [Lentinula aciculospora]|uniref:SART-1 family-domain-containing protein n=1 Tax=Lentinula aciculospora TaxID=153920 RepID=A0A9W9A9W0_9AGAR|nr:SART-1 family-domain-containing protein [Lentinula aciculospora]
MSMEESISVEETNRIRISIGLEPLTDDSKPADDKDKQAEDNYAKKREREAKERETKVIADRIAKVRNRRELNASLKGATLGDADGDAEDTLKWIKKNKKKEKELAKKRLQEFDSMDKVMQEEYTERDLAGLKVSHDFDTMDEGDARILTLKDSRILDNEEDELQNIEMAEEERRQKNIELRTKKHGYTGYDDDEFVDGNVGMKRAVLAKYDEEIEGVSEIGFRLGSSVVSKKTVDKQKNIETAASLNKSLLSIDYKKNLEITDYLKEGDFGFKKPKTKKKRINRRVPAEAELAAEDEMDVDATPVPRIPDLDVNFVDDDELQAALARSRRAKLTRPKKVTPEELARRVAEEQVAQEREALMKARDEDVKMNDEEETKGLVFNDTSEFVRAVGNNPIAVKKEPTEKPSPPPPESLRPSLPSRNTSMAPEDVVLNEMEVGEAAVKDEDEEDDMEILNRIEAAIKAEEAEQHSASDEPVGTSSEQTFKSGMASTLNILRQQGILSAPSSDQKDREHTQLQRDLWLADQRRRIAQRELERLHSRGGNRDQATREYENRLREQQEARENLEMFKHYKPDVNIVYYDEHGRALTPKEAWKALSHKFHGKGSGKMKTEKRLKKIEEEKKQLAMASGDTPLSMSAAFQQRQQKAGQAHFVLSVGNRGAVPQAADFFDAQPLSKGKTEKMKKKKETKNAKAAMESGLMTLPTMALNGGSPAPSGFASVGSNGSPGPRAGFSRISSMVDVTFQSGTATPGERSKVAFGFGTKRKADEEAAESPPAKRR